MGFLTRATSRLPTGPSISGDPLHPSCRHVSSLTSRYHRNQVSQASCQEGTTALSTDKQNRQVVVEEMRKKEQSASKRRTALTVGACVLVGGGIIAAAAVPVLNREPARPTTQIGVDASAAGCLDVVTKPADGGNDHRPNNEDIKYAESPPAFGPHYAMPVPMERKFYTVDRPAVETLVHNLEHGFTILWYDETIATDETSLAEVEEITRSFPASTGLADKFIAVPWTSEDGDAFPKDTHVALTHWSLGGDSGDPADQEGVWLYCGEPSGDVVQDFVTDYPFTDAPEGMVPGEYGEEM